MIYERSSGGLFKCFPRLSLELDRTDSEETKKSVSFERERERETERQPKKGATAQKVAYERSYLSILSGRRALTA